MSRGGRLRAVAFSLAAVSALSLVPLASGREQAFPDKAGKLVFQSNRDGDHELYLASADGSGVRKPRRQGEVALSSRP